MLGGLGTPRPSAEIDATGRVMTRDGVDVTDAFDAGAHAVAAHVYDGTFSKTRVAGGEGVTAALLLARGVAVFSEDQLDAADAFIAAREATRATRSTAR